MATRTIPQPVQRGGYSPRQRYLGSLLLTSFLGTLVSIWKTSPQTTQFRSRLPSTTLTHLESKSSTPTLFPIPDLPYFADKRNSFNQLFVKRSWAWVTVIYLVYSLSLFLSAPLLDVKQKQDPPPPTSSQSSSRNARSNPSQPIIQLSKAAKTPFELLTTSLRRYLLSTLFWFYLTQKTWFGTTTGPSISHRILRSSGAVCVPSKLSSSNGGSNSVVESVVCTGQSGEYWRGGHDVSGHSFMLIHCSMFLFELLHPLLPSLFPRYFTSTSTRTQPRKLPIMVKLSCYAALMVMALCWWMLLMTSLFFHSPGEKLSGVAFGVMGWWIGGL